MPARVIEAHLELMACLDAVANIIEFLFARVGIATNPKG